MRLPSTPDEAINSGDQFRLRLPPRRPALTRSLIALIAFMPAMAGCGSSATSGPVTKAKQSSSGYLLYVTTHDGVMAIDTATGVEKAIPLAARPSDIALAPDGDNSAYVLADSPFQRSIVIPINLASDTSGMPIPLSDGSPGEIAITPDGKTAYATGGGGVVTPIDLHNSVPGSPLVIGGSEIPGIAIAPDGKFAYASNDAGVFPIAIASNLVLDPLTRGGGIIAISADSKTALMYEPDAVVPINLTSGEASPPIPVKGLVGVIVIAPGGKTAYVESYGPDSSAGPVVSIVPIDLAKSTAEPAIPIGYEYADHIVITPDGQTAFVSVYIDPSQGGGVIPIDLRTGALGKLIPVRGADMVGALVLAS